MLRSILNAGNSNEDTSTRRRYPRRNCDKCVGVVNGRIYPIYDWSPGGALIEGDERAFSVGDDVSVTMKFRLHGSVLSLDHQGRIIRKTDGKVAVQFIPLTQQIWHGFKKVIDDHVTSEFANSQMVH